MNEAHLNELLLQALETERGGIQVYATALKCVVHPELRKEWEKYLDQTKHHERILLEVFETLGLDPKAESPGREIVHELGESLVSAMETALEAGDKSSAQLVATECIVLAETKDHQNWELIGEVVTKTKGKTRDALHRAHEQIEDQEDEHYYHTAGWSRELWIDFLGMPAVLPPPEEEKDVKTAIGAARAKRSRVEML